jgi:uncharacterized protein with LGFP repeats
VHLPGASTRRRAALLTVGAALLTAVVTGPVTQAAAESGTTAQAAAGPTWFQPGATWTGDFGDPTVVRVGNTYYAYASPVGGRELPVLTSTDLKTWTVRARYTTSGPPGAPGYSVANDRAIPDEIRANKALSEWGKYDTNDALVKFPSWGVVHPQGPWINRDYWAPGVGRIGTKWYAYSPVRVSATRFCLTAASSSSPLGPFRDISGSGPIQCQDIRVDPGGSIDPFPYHDDATGKDYLLWKASGKLDDHPSALMSVQLGSDGLPKAGAVPVKLLETDAGSPWEGNTIENPSMLTSNGTTYLFYSGNLSDALDDQGRSNYASGYAICPHGPTAPCHRAAARVPLLTSMGSAQGPGGSSGFVDAQGTLRMAYATFRLGENVGGEVPHPRRMSIATLIQNPDGTLRVDGSLGSTAQIDAKWRQLGGAGGVLGARTTDEKATSKRAGSYATFEHGAIYWSPTTGAHAVIGTIRDRWKALGSENGYLGFPTSDQLTLAKGTFSRFEGGSIYWSKSTGAHAVRGAIRDRWGALGWENGFLGYPTTSEIALRGGALTAFQGGSVYWSPATGAHAVRGAIRDRWGALGWENGFLGYPTTDEIGLRGGAFTAFQGGSVYWSPATGAHAVRGAIRDAWGATGWENGSLGYPTSDEFGIPGGQRTNFQRGYITWTPQGGAVVHRA